MKRGENRHDFREEVEHQECGDAKRRKRDYARVDECAHHFSVERVALLQFVREVLEVR